MAKNLTGYRGDSKTINLTFKTDAGVAINITGWTIFFTAKASKTDADAAAAIQKNVTAHTNASGGITDIVLAPADTIGCLGNYFYDIQAKKADGTILTVVDGIITFKEDITIRTTAV
ncbi:MAG: hypothetical protein WCO84_07210 [bacterium]